MYMAHEHHTHAMFDEDTVNALREIFNGFKREVIDYLVIVKDMNICPTCGEAEHLANELMKIAGGKLRFEVLEKDSGIGEKLMVRYTPAFIYGTRRKNIRYYGLPSGQEFAPFIYIHQYIANDEVRLSREALDIVESIENPIHVKVFVTPECPYCPIVVDAVNQMGLVNDELLVETIEALELPIEADKYHVMYVPYIVINDPRDWREYGVKPVEVINGYVPPEDIAKIIYDASKRIGRG